MAPVLLSSKEMGHWHSFADSLRKLEPTLCVRTQNYLCKESSPAVTSRNNPLLKKKEERGNYPLQGQSHRNLNAEAGWGDEQTCISTWMMEGSRLLSCALTSFSSST